MIKTKTGVPRKHLVGHLLTFLSWVFVTGFAIILKPSLYGHGTHQQLGLPPCGSVLLFHRPCPGCGLTTSFTNTVHGHLIDAFKAHWLGPLIYVVYSVVALLGGYGFVTKTYYDTNSPRLGKWIKAFIVIFIIYGVGRFILVREDYMWETPIWERGSASLPLIAGQSD